MSDPVKGMMILVMLTCFTIVVINFKKARIPLMTPQQEYCIEHNGVYHKDHEVEFCDYNKSFIR